SSLCTLVGAVVGAIPPVMGYTAATGTVGAGAWILFAVLFAWQIPHFLSLAWLYRDDYRRGGYVMLPLGDPTGRITFEVTVLYALALVPLGLASFLAGLTGWASVAGSLALGGAFFALTLALRRRRGDLEARRVFLASLLYLPLLLALLVADHALR
nr:protoheme IX farnesyltransferase [Acidobacteriota bacterium]